MRPRRSAPSATSAGWATILWQSKTPRSVTTGRITLCSVSVESSLPPVWYKSAPYRSRAVKDPRVCSLTLASRCQWTRDPRLGLDGETRFLVVPMRPAGTEGWSEDKLAELVTRDP
jgi:hypothetical protein